MNAATATARIAADLADPTNPFPSAGVHPPAPQSLANGATGVALLHIERANAGTGDWATAHAWLAAATTGAINAGLSASLFHGAPALAHTLHAAHHPQAYRRAREALHATTITLTSARLDRAHARIDRGDAPALAEFDLLRGLTGLGAYLLHADTDSPITADLLTYLVRLTEPRPDGLPGWWTDHGPTGNPLPGGHGNLGIAHGIAGPLALLALAHRRGLIVDGHTQAITRICAWYDTWAQDHLHHAHVVVTQGDSFRLAQATSGKGVMPLN